MPRRIAVMGLTITAIAVPMAGLSSTAVAEAATTAYTSPVGGGITAYFEPSGIYATFEATLGANTGSLQIQDYNALGDEIRSYGVTVSCTSYPAPGVVYYGGEVTSGYGTGYYVMDELIAGGPGVGEVGAGYFSKTLTCYNGNNGSLVDPLAPLVTPNITVTQGSSTASTEPPGPGIAAYFSDSAIYSDFSASLGANEGTVQVTDYNDRGGELYGYSVSVSCTSYPAPGIAYYGGEVLSSGSFTGYYMMDELIAGGPGAGEVGRGYFSKTLTCYNGENGSLVGELAPLSTPAIVVTS